MENFEQTYNEIKEDSTQKTMQVAAPSHDGTKKVQGIILTIIFIGVSFVAGFASAKSNASDSHLFDFLSNSSSSSTTTTTQDVLSSTPSNTKIERVGEVLDIINSQYVDKNLDQGKLIDSAIKGLVDGVGDSHSEYFTAADTAAYDKQLAGNFDGIGAELAYNDGWIYMRRFLDNSPASKAGFKVGDYITKVDDYKVVKDDNISDLVQKIKGKAGTSVKIEVADDSTGKNAHTITVTRAPIVSKSMDFEDKGNGIIEIRLSRFTESTLGEFEANWDQMVKDILAKNPKKLVLDLRANPGGYLDGAFYLASEFLQKGKTVLHVAGRNGIEQSYIVDRTGRLLDIPMVILVNEYSASAAEIFSGALQQNGRAKIIGVNTYGKGTAQKVIVPANWGGASLHITVQRWLLPDKRNISNTSPIVPDIVKETTLEDIKAGRDPVYDVAVEQLNK